MKKNQRAFGLTLFRLVLLAALLLAPVVSAPPAPVQAGESGPTDPGSPAVPDALAGVFLPLVSKPYTPPPASSQEKIYAKYEAGEIDYETYLLYRAYALYGDLQLPAELRGPIAEDTTLFFEIEEPQHPLSAAALAALHPYLVRPDHPDSAVNGKLPLPDAPGLNAPLDAGLPAEFSCKAVDQEGNSWATLDSTTLPVRVHQICFNNPNLDKNYVLPGMQKVIGILEALWGPMTAHMGATPLLDAGGAELGGNERVDIYIIARSQVFQRDEPIDFPKMAAAFVRPTPAKTPARPKAAGFMVLDQDDVAVQDDDHAELKSTIAHEFFHLLQYAHNAQIMRNFFGEAYWFNDASAEWAAWHFVPEARRNIHAGRFPGFQDDDLPLNVFGVNGSMGQQHGYDAYIWPFFMEQQAGPEAIAAAWDGLTNANTFSQANTVLNNQVSFTDSFHLFALRNLVDLRNFGNAIPNPYMQFDPQFPKGLWPRITGRYIFPVLEGPQAVEVSLAHLTAEYYHIEFEQEVKKVELDFAGIQPADFLDIDALVYVVGQGWQLRHWSGSSQVQLCFDQEPVSELYLSISNTDFANEKPINGNFSVFPRSIGCTCENLQQAVQNVAYFEGTIDFNFSAQASYDDESLSVSQSAHVLTTIPAKAANNFPWMDVAPKGQGKVDYTHRRDDNLLVDTHGDGEFTPYGDQSLYSRTFIAFHYDTCTYRIHATLYAPGRQFDYVAPVWVGSFTTPELRVDTSSMILSGGQAFPVYSEDYVFMQNPPLNFADITYHLTLWDGQGTHTATVSWNLQPVSK